MDQPSEHGDSGLTRSDDGGDRPVDQLFERVYDELRRLAHHIRGAQDGDTLRTTALVHEAYLKLASSGSLEVKSREHFFAVAARAMRQILVDAARRQVAKKRGGAVQWVSLDESAHPEPVRPAQLIALDEALTRLEASDPRLAQVVEQRIFAGLTTEETAKLLGVSRPTIDRDWRAARAWLAVELAESPA